MLSQASTLAILVEGGSKGEGLIVFGPVIKLARSVLCQPGLDHCLRSNIGPSSPKRGVGFSHCLELTMLLLV